MTNKAKIFEKGTMVSATKLPVFTIGLGNVAEHKEVPGTICHENGKVVICTKEQPEGCVYDQERTAVVRVIGEKVLMNGLYDIYAPENSKVEKILSNPVDLFRSLTDEQLEELKPLFEACVRSPRASMAPAEYGRRVIIITDEMISEGITECYNEWEPETPCKLCSGDVFVVTDESQMTGYRIGKDEFSGTHALD